MDFWEVIGKRRSIRKFSSQIVEWEKIIHLIEAAHQAPSSGNLQNWRFIIVDDPSLKTRIAEACLEQYWMITAPCFIVVCSETTKVIKYYHQRGKLYAIQNCAVAIQNLLLAAEDLGLGACWVGAFDEKTVKDLLKVPDNVDLQAIIPVGYPLEKPKKPVKLDLVSLIYFNEWGNTIKSMEKALHHYAPLVEKKLKKIKEKIFSK